MKYGSNMVITLKEELLHRNYEFPITTQKVFMAHAAASPLPRCVSSAMKAYLDHASSEGQWEFLYKDIEEDTRRLAAQLLGADSEEIAFVSSTSMGLSLVASGLSWKNDDNIVIARGDFPSNIYPWMNLKSKGVRIRFIPGSRDGAVTLNDVKAQIDNNTRLVSLSSVNYATGYKIDIPSIGRFLHDKGILFCIDAIQSLGAIPIDTTYVDFLSAGAHKWLLGPLGIGILYVKKKDIGRLSPVLTGWKCVKSNKDYLNYNLDFLDSAQCLEPGGINITGIIGLHAALELLLNAGIDIIDSRLRGFRKILIPALMQKGYELIGSAADEQSSGITAFYSPNLDMAILKQELDKSGFVVSLREIFGVGKCIRVSPHFYNLDDDITSFVNKLPACNL